MAALLSVGRILPAFAERFPHDGARREAVAVADRTPQPGVR